MHEVVGRRVVGVLAVVVFCCAGGGPAVAQPIDLRVDRAEGVEDYDFAWVHWFETHGGVYLREAVSERELPWDTPASRRWRGEAREALLGMLDDRDDGVRAAAVTGLARMGDEALLGWLVPGAGGELPQAGPGRSLLVDASAGVRLAAWTALGQLDVPVTRGTLAVEPIEGMTEQDRAAQAMGIGLLKSIEGVHRDWLIKRMDDAGESAEVKRWCIWSLNRHDDAAMDVVFDATLRNLPSTFLISEVLQNPGYVQRRGGAALLFDVLRYHPDVRGWSGYQALSGLEAAGLYGSSPRRLAMETRVAAALTLATQPRRKDAKDRRELLGLLRRRMVGGNSAQVMDFNRGFDTIAYFMHCDGDSDDLNLLYDQLRGFTQLLADDPAVTEGLKEGEEPDEDALQQRQSDNAVRGYAALATGLLIRRATEGTALFEDRPLVGREAVDIERLKRRFGIRLMRAVADEDEPNAYRAACALALGLTGDARYKGELSEALGKLRGGDEAVFGYGLLALAMLGEDRAAEPARRYVTRPGLVSRMEDRLGRRAALRALSLIGARGGDDLKQALAGAWGRDAWVSLSVAQTTAWSGRYDAVGTMIEATRSESVSWRRASALSLGLAFERDYPSRLLPLVEGANPTLSYLSDRVRPKVDTGEIGFNVGDFDPPLEQPGPDGNPKKATDRGWPLLRLHAIGDPFVFEAMRDVGPPTPIEDADQDDAE